MSFATRFVSYSHSSLIPFHSLSPSIRAFFSQHLSKGFQPDTVTRGGHGSVRDENWTELFAKFKITELNCFKPSWTIPNWTELLLLIPLKKIWKKQMKLNFSYRTELNCFESNWTVSNWTVSELLVMVQFFFGSVQFLVIKLLTVPWSMACVKWEKQRKPYRCWERLMGNW